LYVLQVHNTRGILYTTVTAKEYNRKNPEYGNLVAEREREREREREEKRDRASAASA